MAKLKCSICECDEPETVMTGWYTYLRFNSGEDERRRAFIVCPKCYQQKQGNFQPPGTMVH